MSFLGGIQSFLGGRKPQQPTPPTSPPDISGSVAMPKSVKTAASLSDLPEELRSELISIMSTLHLNDRQARNQVIKGALKARLFWKSIQYIRFSEGLGSWEAIRPENELDPAPVVVNVFQKMGLAIAQVFSTVPACIYLPMDADNPEDVATAEAAQPIADLFARNNDLDVLLSQIAYLMYCDPYIGGRVYHRLDGERWGWHDEDEMTMEQGEAVPESYACANCGTSTPTAAMPPPVPAAPGAMPPIQTGMAEDPTLEAEEGLVEASHAPCPSCGSAMDSSNIQPPFSALVPRVVATHRIPNGAEVLELSGALELVVPSYAKEFHAFPYLTHEAETHRSLLIGTYGEPARDVSGTDVGDWGRQARLMTSNGGQGADGIPGVTIQTDLVTLRRTWLRPWVFQTLVDEKQRKQLMDLFPDGCYAAYVGDQLLDVRNESMSDTWEIAFPNPGDGAIREGLGSSFIPMQELLNELINLEAETHRFGISPIFADTSMVDTKELAKTRVKPGYFYPVTPRGAKTVENSTWSPTPAQVSAQLVSLRREIANELGEGLTGALPALSGAEMGGAGDTSSGYKQAHDYAMGRIGIPWRAVKNFIAGCNEKAVYAAKKFRMEDITMSEKTDDGSYQNKVISISSLKGDIRAYPEVNEDYPMSWSDRRKVWEGFMNSQNPAVQAVATSPRNMAQAKILMGMKNVHIPGEAALKGQEIEITALLAGKVQPVLDQNGMPPMDPMTGMPVVDPMTGMPPVKSSVPIDPIFDEHEFHFDGVQYWLESPAGRKAKIQNPDGWANVRQHGIEHKMAMMPPPPPPGAPGPPEPQQGGPPQ